MTLMRGDRRGAVYRSIIIYGVAMYRRVYISRICDI